MYSKKSLQFMKIQNCMHLCLLIYNATETNIIGIEKV